MAQGKTELGHAAGLFCALVFLLVVMPFVSEGGPGAVFMRVAVSVVLLAGLFAASDRRWILWVGMVLALPTFGVQWSTHFYDVRGGEMARAVSSALFFGFTTMVVLRGLTLQDRVSLDTIIGGINVYLLIGITFMLVHYFVELAIPGAYIIHGVPFSEAMGATLGDAQSTLLYFSFTTVTTLGYGDINPVASPARMVSAAEAVIGQLYVAIFIARLVSLRSGRRRDADDGKGKSDDSGA